MARKMFLAGRAQITTLAKTHALSPLLEAIVSGDTSVETMNGET